MAKQAKIAAEKRTAVGRGAVRKLKTTGVVPAVVYGGKSKPQPLQVSRKEISALLSHAAGENILVELEVAGEKGSRMALLQEVQHAPVGGAILHVDFHAVSMDEKIQAGIPVEAFGIANGVKNFGGLLEQALRTLEVECLPRDLPEKITVDVSELNIGDSIHVRDLKLPAGVTAKAQPDLTVLSVMEPTVEEEPVAAVADAAAGPEVIKEKKVEGEAAPAAGAPPAKEQKK
ncbi:MAG: 50S ribosomal protein L25 [Verrucomicrobiota bacterium]|nr:50S ribosomal protein L25 [Verrucomicrobiota bacterium]